MLGGITMAIELAVAINAVVMGALKPPLSTIAGIRTAPSAATVAGPDPEIAPKKQATITHTIAIPPLLCPTQVSTNLTSLLEIPAFAIIFPESTKKGIARSRNLLIPAYILVATMVSDVPEYRIAHTEDSPRQIAIGTPMIRKIKNETNKTALIIYLSSFLFLSVQKSMQNSIKCKIIHPDPMGTKDQKIHSGQFNTKVRFPFASCVRTLSMPNQNKMAVKITHRIVLRITDGFFIFSGRRSVTSDRLTNSPSRHANAAAINVTSTKTATTSSSVKDQERWMTLRENTFPTVKILSLIHI